MPKRLRYLLPVMVSAIVVPLIVWDVFLDPRRIGYDAGTPFWPFQVPNALLGLFDLPAILLARPFWNLLHAYSALSRDALVLLATPLVWYWIGNRIDFGLLRPPYRFPRALALILSAVAIALIISVILDLKDDISWWQRYGNGSWFGSAITMRSSIGFLWVLVFLAACIIAARRLFHHQTLVPVATSNRDHRITLSVLTIWAAVFALTPAVEAIRDYNHADMSRGDYDPDSCVNEVANGCIHGSVIGQDAKPIRGLYLNAVPMDSPANLRKLRGMSRHTDRKGRYSFDELDPGDYIIGISIYLAPSAEQPYPTTYYPAAVLEADAQHLHIEAGKKLNLAPFVLRQIPLTTFTVEVRWPDGSHPLRSNLLVRNIKFQQAAIGEAAPQIDNGSGSFTLPQNFDYEVSASVQCDEVTHYGGQRETPYLPLQVTSQPEPPHLVLTLPGSPCTLR